MSAQGRSYGLGITVVTEPNDSMAATQAAINRQPYPLSSYQTPQSNSPASIHSPQTDAHGRPMYQMPPMAQQMYYQYPIPQQQQPPYTPQQSSAPQHPSLTSAPGMLVSHQPPQQPQQQQHPLSQPPQQHVPGHQQQPSVDTKPPPNLQRPPSVVNQSHGGPQTPSGPGMLSSSIDVTGTDEVQPLDLYLRLLHLSCDKTTTACSGSPSNTRAIA